MEKFDSEEQQSDRIRLAKLDAAIARGTAAADAGRVKPAGEVFDRLEAKYRALTKVGRGSPSR